MGTMVWNGRRQSRQPRPQDRRRFDFSPWETLPPVPATPLPASAPAPARVPWWERAAALVLLVLGLPALLLIALAIKIDSPGGSVFYRQERVGVDRRTRRDKSNGGQDRRTTPGAGRVFMIYKHRTMIPDAESRTGPVWAAERDPRVTRVGHVLRHLRLDEVPQLINILKGEMRLIGPRPERPHFVNQLVRQVPTYAERQKVPPGITGLAQVERHYDASVKDVATKVKYDLYYAENRSSRLDLKILVKTLDVVVRGRGAR